MGMGREGKRRGEEGRAEAGQRFFEMSPEIYSGNSNDFGLAKMQQITA